MFPSKRSIKNGKGEVTYSEGCTGPLTCMGIERPMTILHRRQFVPSGHNHPSSHEYRSYSLRYTLNMDPLSLNENSLMLVDPPRTWPRAYGIDLPL